MQNFALYILQSAFIVLFFSPSLGIPLLVGVGPVILARSLQSRPAAVPEGSTTLLAPLGDSWGGGEYMDHSSPIAPFPGLTHQNPQSWPWASVGFLSDWD